MKVSKQIIYSALALIFLLILIGTNPKEYQLQEYIKRDLKNNAIEEGGISGAVKEIFAGAQSSLMGLTIERKNFFVISLYKVEGFNKEHKYLGILNTFIEL